MPKIKNPKTGIFKNTTFKTIETVSWLGKSPAAVEPKKGDLYLADWFHDLEPDYKRFIVLHEQGHYFLQTSVEQEADDYAFKNYAAEGRPLSKSILALSSVLTSSPEHQKRIFNGIGNALDFKDFLFNGECVYELKTTKERMKKLAQAMINAQQKMVECLKKQNYEAAIKIANTLIEKMPAEQEAAYIEYLKSCFDQYGYDLKDSGEQGAHHVFFDGEMLRGCTCQNPTYHGADVVNFDEDNDLGDLETLYYNDNDDYDGEYDDPASENYGEEEYLGADGAARKRRLTKKQKREQELQQDKDERQRKKSSKTDRENERREAIDTKRKDRGEAAKIRAQAKLELAKQGITQDNAATVLGKGLEVVGGIFGKKKSGGEEEEVPEDYEEEESGGESTKQERLSTDISVDVNNTDKPTAKKILGMPVWVFVLVLVIVVFILAGLGWYFVRSRKAA